MLQVQDVPDVAAVDVPPADGDEGVLVLDANVGAEAQQRECTRSNARLIQLWSCTPHQPPCGTSDKNTWCHKCLHHNMHTLPEQEEKDLGRGWHVRTTEVGQPMRLN